MTILSDLSLRMAMDAEHLRIDPLGENAIQPCSVDLTLGDTLLCWPNWVPRDPRFDQSKLWKPVDRIESNAGGVVWLLKPGNRYLATTRERLTLPAHLAGQLDGRSTWARDGLIVHKTAGWLDAGFDGCPTLELSVVGSDLVIWPGADCVQLIVMALDSECERPYGSHGLRSRYQGSRVPTPAQMRAEVSV